MFLPILTDGNPLWRRRRTPEEKEALREMERTLGEVSETAGWLLEKINNAEDSVENFADAVDPVQRINEFVSSFTIDEAIQKLKKGDHIKCNRTVYSHHGIYIGDGEVIAYDDSIVKSCSLEEFADGDGILRVEEKAIYSPDRIVSRAWSRVGETDYNLIVNNCENFATWCRCGRE